MLLKCILRTSLGCLLFLCTNFAWSQATTSLGGRVTDASGAVIPAANVKLTSFSRGTVRSVNTSGSGEYEFLQLPPGRYELTVSSSGFATAEKTSLELLVSQPATVNVVLQVATSRAEVTVTAGIQPVLNTTDATLGNAFDGQQIQNLPSEARNVPDLLSLQPGVTFLGVLIQILVPSRMAIRLPTPAAAQQMADDPTSRISRWTALTLMTSTTATPSPACCGYLRMRSPNFA
jgi:hypothetical protein